jgi:hypothetical protein
MANYDGFNGESFVSWKLNYFNIIASSTLRTISSIIPELFATFFFMSLKLFIAFLQFYIKSFMPKLDKFLLSCPCYITLFTW